MEWQGSCQDSSGCTYYGQPLRNPWQSMTLTSKYGVMASGLANTVLQNPKNDDTERLTIYNTKPLLVCV
jgi:hypothetical protein